jgi:hypothetical protein
MFRNDRLLPFVRQKGRRVPRWLTAALLALWAFAPAEAYASCKQPVYIVAHRCNDPNDGPSAAKEEGVNAIEADFSWGSRSHLDDTGYDDEWAVDHEGVLPHSTYLDNWLADVKLEVHRQGTPLSLIILDIKDPYGPLLDLYQKVRGELGPEIYLLLSIGNFKGGVDNFHKLKDAIDADERAGVAIDDIKADVTQTQVQDFFKGLDMKRYWFGDGIAAGALEPASIENHVNQGIALRDSEISCSAFHGVYTWTYEEQDRIKFYVNKGVNGIFVNSQKCNGFADYLNPDLWSPPEAVAFAKTLANRKFATPADDPFDLSPAIECPTDTTVECTSPGGTPRTDSQLASFFSAAKCSSGYCNPLVLSDDAPSLFSVGTTTDVTFTATGDVKCSSNCSAKVTVQDTVSPIIACPADITQDPVSLQGNVVTFNATAADTCDAGANVQCSPPSGSLFASGPPTTVTCTAKDASNNQVPCSFNVKIYTPQEVIANLEAAAASLAGLNQGQKNSLLSLLSALLESINDGNSVAICGQLDGLIAKVAQWISGGVLTSAEGQPLITSAKNLKKTYGCS